MRLSDELRLLPWAGPEGKLCYLASDGAGFMSRLADQAEAVQLGLAGELIEEAQQVLADRAWTPGELHLLTVQLTEALADAHRIAVSRGARLPLPACEDSDAVDYDVMRPWRSPPSYATDLPSRRLKRWKRRHNSSHAKIRCFGEQAMATLKGWRLLRKLRCSTNRITNIVKAVLALHHAST
jgi:hypothetical protein